ncbi:carbonic anhydrase [Trichoderma sp. SZMC 28011]
MANHYFGDMDGKPANYKPAYRPTVEELLQRNKEYAATVHKPWPDLPELLEWTSPSTIVIACSDPRCDPQQFMQGRRGEIAAIRNLGGQVEISIVDIATLDSEFQFKELVVVHHTNCGVISLTADGVSEYLKENLPSATKEELAAFPIALFSNMEEGIRHDLEVVRKSPYIRKELKESARGFIFDIKTGLLTEVV